MPRALALSNGRLHVAFDERYHLRDLTWPRVGWESHTAGHPSRLGVYAARRFSWVHSDAWARGLRSVPGALASDVRLTGGIPGISLAVSDVVLPDRDVLLRRVAVGNAGDRSKEVRLFFHHDFHLLGTDVGDTVAFDPATGGLLHYKRDRYVLSNGVAPGGAGPAQWACGQKEFAGLEGTYRDAEDGKLSMNPMSHGSVDGVLALHVRAPREGSAVAWQWLACARDGNAARRLDSAVRAAPEEHHARAVSFWRGLTGRSTPAGFDRLPAAVAALYRQSLALVHANLDEGGGVLAANDSDILSFNRDTYAYVWPRDAAFVVHALGMAGHPEPAARFFGYVAPLLADAGAPHGGGYLDHKYTVDGLLASSWHPRLRDGRESLPIQEDETALVAWALVEHGRTSGDVTLPARLYDRFLVPACDFLVRYRDPATGLPLPSWDLWEERYGVHAFTVATVVAALRSCAGLARFFGDATRASRWRGVADEVAQALARELWMPKEERFARRLTPEGALDPTPDASLAALAWFDVFPAFDPRLRGTLRHVFRSLRVKTPVGGIARYEGDAYHRVVEDPRRVPGNPWFVCTLWEADWRSAAARTDAELSRAMELLEWCAARALPSGVLAEQIHPETGAPLSVAPLTWSHAAFVESVHRWLAAAQRARARAKGRGGGAAAARTR